MQQHTVKRAETLSAIARSHGVTLNALLAANPAFKANPDRLAVGDVLDIPPGENAPPPPAPPRASASDFVVERGQLTFDAEGVETPGPYFSRVPHVPGPTSGVTIGRGYDLKERSRQGAAADLGAAAVEPAHIQALIECCGLHGARARRHLDAQGLTTLKITAYQQKKLFELVYAELEGDVRRICDKHDVVEKFGRVNWPQLQPRLRDIAVDLRYRGDYTPRTREEVQPLLVANDLDGLRRLLADRAYWVGRFGVPNDRYKRRRDYLA